MKDARICTNAGLITVTFVDIPHNYPLKQIHKHAKDGDAMITFCDKIDDIEKVTSSITLYLHFLQLNYYERIHNMVSKRCQTFIIHNKCELRMESAQEDVSLKINGKKYKINTNKLSIYITLDIPNVNQGEYKCQLNGAGDFTDFN